ncbi:hypothetical protein HDU93_010102 [Gonapodya sp. JEL0774]|nr:hypothetical protein HDU93_010102 [Gonapodya sp. JEL0774]
MWMSWNGGVYDMSYYYHPTPGDLDLTTTYYLFAGSEISPYFPRYDPQTGALPTECAGATLKLTKRMMDLENPGLPGHGFLKSMAPTLTPRANSSSSICSNSWEKRCMIKSNINCHCHNTSQIAFDIKYKNINIVYQGPLGYSEYQIATHNTQTDAWMIVNDRIYNTSLLINTNPPIFGQTVDGILQSYKGRDATVFAPNLQDYLPCLEAGFFIGVVDRRNSARCQASTYILYSLTGIVVGIMIIKFLSALQLSSKRIPEDQDKYTIMLVPCYTEGEDSLRKTINSLALLHYVDERKLLFVIADGMIRGSGNDRSTPEIVLGILGIDMKAVDEQHPALSYFAIGEGSKQHNKAKVYSGFYHIQARTIPFIVVVKVGKETETARPGNRGKRDTQMILMRFLNHVHFRSPMPPLELEIFRQIQETVGTDPYNFEYILMVDADTEVMPDSLNRLISSAIHDTQIMGISGETQIANQRRTMVTMMQVYEYYISHHLAKAFESLFGNVTCLPGCFTMYRIRTPVKNRPLLVADEILAEYADSNVDTLHKKNLLSLGEDRYLTTIMLKTFPDMRTKFTADAQCKTVVPDKFKILMSQRRRWINSTVHNQFELLFINQLCGCLCFSMRSIVALDLFSTVTMPAAVAYLIYLIISSIKNVSAPTISLIMIGVGYGVQVIIFILKRRFEHIGWMIISILSSPFFSLLLPLYSFWNMDDFSWGTTRQIAGQKAGADHGADDEVFDPSEIPTITWDDFEKKTANIVGDGQYSTTPVPGFQVPTPVFMQPSPPVQNSAPYGRSGSPTGSDTGSEHTAQSRSRMIHGMQTQINRDFDDSASQSGHSYISGYAPPGSYVSAAPSMIIPVPGGMMAIPGMPMMMPGAPQMMPQGYYGMGYSPYQMATAGMMPGAPNPYMMNMAPTPTASLSGASGYSPIPMQQIPASSLNFGAPLGNSLFPAVRPAEAMLPHPGATSDGEETSEAESIPAAANAPSAFPSDDEIVWKIRTILSNTDLRLLTKRKVRDQLQSLYGQDMSSKKAFINETVEKIVKGEL